MLEGNEEERIEEKKKKKKAFYPAGALIKCKKVGLSVSVWISHNKTRADDSYCIL